MRRGIGFLMVFAVLVTGVGAAWAKPARPDLVVTKGPRVPATVDPGTHLKVKDVVRNKGRRKARRSVTRYYLSLDRTRDKGDQRLAGKRVVKRLKPRRLSRGRARVRIPAGLALGQYRLLACADDRRKVRESRERNNCRASRVVEVVQVGEPTPGHPDQAATPVPETPAPEPAGSDTDGDGIRDVEDSDDDNDGVADDADCKPLDPAVHPGADDAPGGDYSDTDCDGVDGTASEAIFAATFGNDADAGTREKPKRSINAAISTAKAAGVKDVYVAFGTYDETLDVVEGVSVYGGYRTDWTRSGGDVTTLAGSPSADAESVGALSYSVKSPTTLQHLTFAPRPPTEPGASSYGLRAVESPGLILDTAIAIGAPGTAGTHGTDGEAGRAGVNGQSCPPDGYAPRGLAGGSSPVGHPGGRGGRGGDDGVLGDYSGWHSDDGETGVAGGGPGGGAGGSGGAAADTGERGGIGQIGAHGVAGADGFGGRGGTASDVWLTHSGSSGAPGGHGSGGGGGGGGQGGGRGTHGSGGGGSFGIYVTRSPGLTIRRSQLTASSGGAGGSGGTGAAGGFGGLGGFGCVGRETEFGWEAAGGHGGPGGSGARGGDGGGGAGGPSIALYTHESAVTTESTSLSFGTAGAGGAGGDSRNPLTRGMAGVAAATRTSAENEPSV